MLTGRYKRSIGKMTIKNALRFALSINSGILFFICKSEKSADFPDLLFHEKERNG